MSDFIDIEYWCMDELQYEMTWNCTVAEAKMVLLMLNVVKGDSEGEYKIKE